MRRYVKYYTFGKGYHDDPDEAPVLPAPEVKPRGSVRSAIPALPNSRKPRKP